MGCFGDMTPVSTTTSGPEKWARKAGRDNYGDLQDYYDQGFQPYTQPRVADLSSDEVAAGNTIRGIGANPNLGYATDAATTYGQTPGATFDFNTLVDENGPLGTIQSYMNPYLDKVLDPLRREIALKGSKDRLNINKSATGAGAFGDSRHGIVEGEQRRNESTLDSDVTGKAWSDAFMAAMGLRGTDASRLLTTQKTQADENARTLERLRTSGVDLTNLDKSEVARALGLASAQSAYGESERGVEQKKLDTQYEEEMRKQGWTPNMIALMTSILKGTPMNTTSTTSAPNNTGYQAIGSGIGAIASMFSDRRMKENIHAIGELHDGQIVYRFNYKGDPVTQIGLMAQDVEQVCPAAVGERDGFKTVDYDVATRHLIEDKK